MVRRFRPISLAIALFAVAAVARSHAGGAAEDDRYVDRSFGFSFSKPLFAPSDQKGVTTVAVTLAGAQASPFAPNVNVVVHNLETRLDAYEQRQKREFTAVGWEVIEQSHREIGGRPALWTHVRGPLQGVQLESLAIALFRDDKKVFVMTCMASTAQFPLYEAEFERVLTSFVLEP